MGTELGQAPRHADGRSIERGVAVAKGNVGLPSDLPVEVYGGAQVAPASIIEDRPTLGELGKGYIALVLGECGGNKKKAADEAGHRQAHALWALERSGEEDVGDDAES